jgi:hypothetical protein
MGMPYNGANNATDPLVTPWNIEGWTAQAAAADTIEVAPDDFAPSPFPTNLVFAQVTAQYFDFDGNPLSGFLTVMMNDSITVTQNSRVYRMPARPAGRDNSMLGLGINNWGSGKMYIRRGQASFTIMCSDNSAVVTDSGHPLTYHVIEHFLGGQQFDITVPVASTSPVDLRSLIVAGTTAPYGYDPMFPLGNEG